MRFPTKQEIGNVILDGTWSIGLAVLLSRGVITPLTLGASALLFAAQVAGNYPFARTARAVVDGAINFYDDYIDGCYTGEPEPSTIKQFYKTYGQAKRREQPINDGLDEELSQNTIETFASPNLWRRIPGMTWMFGERKIQAGLAEMNAADIERITYGGTRSGRNFKPF